MEETHFSQQLYRTNMAALSAAAPEVACWLDQEGEAGTSGEAQPGRGWKGAIRLAGHSTQPDAITVIIGGGFLHEVADFLAGIRPGHQVFVLEPRAKLLSQGLGMHDLSDHLANEDLVILPPSEAGLETALSRHPQLGLAERVELHHLHYCDEDPYSQAARARLYRMLGQAFSARDKALDWEVPTGSNLLANLYHAAFMADAPGIIGALTNKPAVLVAAGPSLAEALPQLAGRLGGVGVFSTDRALGPLLEAGIIPTAMGATSPNNGYLAELTHPDRAKVPLLAEEVTHASTLRDYPGARFVCLGARGTGLGPFSCLSAALSPQQHAVTRLAEIAALAGCGPIYLVGVDLVTDQGPVSAPGMDGSQVHTTLEQAATARSLGRVICRQVLEVHNTSLRGLGLPGCKVGRIEDFLAAHGRAGQPLRMEALDRERWLTPEALDDYAKGLEDAATSATKLWQRAAAPAADFPHLARDKRHEWLLAADRLFVALAEQASADALQASFLDGCLVRAFRRRYRLICQGRGQRLGLAEVCNGLASCLGEMKERAGELADGLRQAGTRFRELAQARRVEDEATLSEFAASMGHGDPLPEA